MNALRIGKVGFPHQRQPTPLPHIWVYHHLYAWRSDSHPLFVIFY
jgi:hypothetical protein